jgi:hypothetical protein
MYHKKFIFMYIINVFNLKQYLKKYITLELYSTNPIYFYCIVLSMKILSL